MSRPATRDLDGRPRSWGWLVDTFGDVQVIPAPGPPGQDVYRVARLSAGLTGTLLSAGVRQADGRPQPGAWVVRHWPGAPPLPALPPLYGAPAPGEALLPPRRGAAARTGADGLAVFPLAPAEVYALPAAGTSSLYVHARRAPSDLVGGLGVLRAGRLRLCLHVTWQLVPGGGEAWQPSDRLPPPLARLASGQAVILDLLAQIAHHLGVEG